MGSLRLEKGKFVEFRTEAQLKAALVAEGYEVFSWQDPAGAYYSPHKHPHDEFIVVWSGSIDFRIGAELYRLESGDMLVLPKDTVHEAENTGAGAVKYFICS